MALVCARTSRPPRSRDERGAAAVEFALIAPMICLLVFGIISYGYMLSFRQALSQGVGEGSRAAAVAPAPLPVADKKTRAREAINYGLGNYGVTCDGTWHLIKDGAVVGTCAVSAETACSGSTQNAVCVKVSVTYDYREHPLIPSVPGVGFMLPSQLTVTNESQVSN